MITPTLRKQQWWTRFAVLLLIMALLAACGGGGGQEQTSEGATTGEAPAEEAAEPAPAEEAPAEEAPAEEAPAEETTGEAPAGEAGATEGTLRVAVVRGAMLEVMTGLAEEYEAANPGVDVTIEEEPEGGAFEALIAAGNQPDLIVASIGSQIGSLAAQEVVVPLEDMPGAEELFGRLEPQTLIDLYGHRYYVPIGADVTLMIYNKELFEEAGLDPEAPPETYDEFLEAAAAIDALPARENGDEVYGTVFWNEALAWGGWYWNMLQPMYLNANQNQCQLLNRLGTDIAFDAEECEMDAFFEFTRAAQQFAPPTMEKNFFSRAFGMWPQYGYSWEPNLQEAAGEPMVIGEDVGVAPVPVPEEGQTSYTTYGGRAFMILQTSPERQSRAWEFVQFVMQDENNLRFIQELGLLPVLTSLKEDPYFQEAARQPFVAALENAVLPEMYSTADAVANEILGVYQQTVVEEGMEPAEAVETAAEEARSALEASQ